MESNWAGRLPFLVYLNLAILLPIGLFQDGVWRIALLSVFALYLGIVWGLPRANAALPAGLAGIGWPGRLVLFEVAPAAVLLASLGSPNTVRIWEAAVVMLMVAGLLWRGGRLGWGLLGLGLSVALLNLASGLLVPKLSDIATTTVDAVHAVLQGHNPYAAALDTYGAINAHDPAYGGYKYLPLMIAFYLPFVAPFGPMAVLWADALLVAGLCALVWRMSGNQRLIAVAVLLATPELAEASLAMGRNDVLGALLVLAALALRGRSAFLAGLLVGCSLSCKLMPGLVAATIVFPRDRWRGYGAGLALGLVPSVLALAWDPAAFVRNVLVFNLVRAPDVTSWRLHAPAWLGRIAWIGAMALWLGGSGWLALKRPDADRMAPFVIAALLLIMAGSTAHDEYMIWWMPAALVLFAREGGVSVRTACAAPA